MKTWTKNVVAAAVLVTVCAGIYLNWLYSQQSSVANLTDTLNSDKVLSDSTLVLSTEPAAFSELNDAKTTMEDYFAAVRLSRQEARDNAVNLLQEAMAYADGSGQSADQLDNIVQTALSEAQIESLVIAKGYTDCVAYMNQEGISVAVASPEGGLQQEDVALISDIVLSQCSLDLEDIRVVEVN